MSRTASTSRARAREAPDGLLVLPGFVDGHCHLDKTLFGTRWRAHRAENSVAGRIAAERALRADAALPVAERGARLLERMVACGTTALRTHVDIDTSIGLDHLHSILGLRRAWQGLVDIQVVAFPQSGILRDPGTDALLDAALAEGADAIGGLDPVDIDGDRDAHLDLVFRLASRHARSVDIHLHERGETGLGTIEQICRRTLAAGLEGRTVISHAFALGDADPRRLEPVASLLAKARIAILTSAPGQVPMPPVKWLRDAGVEVFAGSDNIRDAWSPFGNGDMLERAMLVAYRQGFRTDEDLAVAFDLITGAARRATGLAGDTGSVSLAAETLAEAIVMRPAARLVCRGALQLARDGRCVVAPRLTEVDRSR
ncbi:MAG: amidohydrolase [Lautropia sp.]